jgi:PAS domain S-box-containing protein
MNSNLEIVGKVIEKDFDESLMLPTIEELKALRFKSRKDSQYVYPMSPFAVQKSSFFLVVPLFAKESFDGFVAAALDAESFFDFGYNIEPNIEYAIALNHNSAKRELFGLCCPNIKSSLVTNLDIVDSRGNWSIQTWPSEKLLAEHGSHLPQVVLIGGLVLSLFTFLVIHFGISSQNRAREMVELNESLESRINERTRELQESDEFTRHWLSRCTDGAWDWNLEKNTVFMTPQFKSLLGYNENEIDESVDNWRRLVPPMDLQVADKAYHEYINSGKRYAYPLRWTHKNGSMVWTLCRGEGIRDNNGKIVRMVGTLTDISQLKRLEEELTHWAEQLERKNSDLEKFNRTVVGREKRMIELKAKVNALSRELGRTEPYKLAFMGEQAESTANDRR